MKAAVLENYGKINPKNIPDPVIKDDEVLVKVTYASICGSDQHIYKGEFHPRTKLPLVPGHEFAGVIMEIGKNVSGFKTGEKVTVDPIIPCGDCPACKRKHYPACTSLKLVGIDLDGGFAEYIAVKPEMIYKLPSSVSDTYAALIELLSIGFHASKRSGLASGDDIVIWGAGKVGNAILHAAKTITKGRVIMVDPVINRLQLAKKAFPEIYTINPVEKDPQLELMKITNGKGVDIAFEAVGHFREIPGIPNPVRSCIKAIRGGGKVCTLGLNDEPVELLMKELIWKEAKIIASRVSHGEFADTIAAFEKNLLNPESMITGIMELEKADEGFQLLENEPERHLKILLRVGRD
jgi:threonine dehydrogenase-like Zn-dependent dehydrogenase